MMWLSNEFLKIEACLKFIRDELLFLWISIEEKYNGIMQKNTTNHF